MNKYDLLDTFFIDQKDYEDFLFFKKQRTISNDEATCFAELTKENDCFLYTLTWLEDDRYIGDYVKLFDPSPENIETFNLGCKIIAERLVIYIDTNEIDLVPSEPPAFAELTYLKA